MWTGVWMGYVGGEGRAGFKDVEGSPEPARGTSIWAESWLGAAAQGRGCQSKPAQGPKAEGH